MSEITSFSGEYTFLSNFYPCAVLFEGETYPSVEHAFQAAKTMDPKKREIIRQAPTPGKAKRMGRRVELRLDWEKNKIDIMHSLLRQKFQVPELRQRLLATEDALLVEGNAWGDVFWGCIWTGKSWRGSNWLGSLLMQVRSELQGERGVNFCKRPDELSHGGLLEIVESIQQTLYYDFARETWDPSKEWDSETIDDIAGVLEDYGLAPRGEEEESE